jgi:hypothetical protein
LTVYFIVKKGIINENIILMGSFESKNRQNYNADHDRRRRPHEAQPEHIQSNDNRNYHPNQNINAQPHNPNFNTQEHIYPQQNKNNFNK